jgi:hypothetical protein
LEQLEEVIEEIRRLMLRSAQESISKGEAEQKEAYIAAGKKQQQQQQQSSGADGQLQRIVWDPGGFQQSWEAHERSS